MSEVDLADRNRWSRQLLRKRNRKLEASSKLENGIAGTIGWSKGQGSVQQSFIARMDNQEEVALFMQKRRWAMQLYVGVKRTYAGHDVRSIAGIKSIASCLGYRPGS